MATKEIVIVTCDVCDIEIVTENPLGHMIVHARISYYNDDPDEIERLDKDVCSASCGRRALIAFVNTLKDKP